MFLCEWLEGPTGPREELKEEATGEGRWGRYELTRRKDDQKLGRKECSP